MSRDTRSEAGASAVEYALVLVGIAAVLAIVIYALGTLTTSEFDHTCDEYDKYASTTAGC